MLLGKLETWFRPRGILEVSLPADAFFTAANNVARTLESADERQVFLRLCCDTLGYDWSCLQAGRLISYITSDEAREMAQGGVDLQLHTHRHFLPDDNFEAAQREIEDNKRALEPVGVSELRHFCYPSGNYSEKRATYLEQIGVVSATTTSAGFNQRKTPRMRLKRFLDSEAITLLEFEAEMCGFFELIRKSGYRI